MISFAFRFGLGLSLFLPSLLHAQPLSPRGDRLGMYPSDTPPLERFLGFRLGDRPVKHHEVLRFFETLSEASPHLMLFKTGKTHEGRTLFYVMISESETLTRYDSIHALLERLADPRILSEKDAMSLAKDLPITAWMGYTVHGDELSGTDASLLLAYYLAFSIDSTAQRLRANAIVCIDPIQNPDGRDRFVSQIEQWTGAMPNWDKQSLNHTGVWPRGRHNHYLFDLNRDWLLLLQPESQHRVDAIQHLKPQLMIDAHEMGSDQTYYFNPPDEPINPAISERTRKWWQRFGENQAALFDEKGWSYFTRDTYDEWYPAYGSSYPSFVGAVGILYEQASTQGSIVERQDGTRHDFAESIERQYYSSISSLTTAIANRRALLMDFYYLRKEGGITSQKGAPQVFFMIPREQNKEREQRFLSLLKRHRIEVGIAEKAFRFEAEEYLTKRRQSREFPKGTYVIMLNQPMGRLAKVLMEFDPRFSTRFLNDEKRELELRGDSKIYDVTGWSLPIAMGLDVYASSQRPAITTSPLNDAPKLVGQLNDTKGILPSVYLLRLEEARSYKALNAALEKGLIPRLAEVPFEIDGTSYGRGTLVFRRHEQPANVDSLLLEIARQQQVAITAVGKGLVGVGSDFGSRRYPRLYYPEIAIMSGQGIEPTSFGPIWHLLDHHLQRRTSLLSVSLFSQYDLEKYQVIILPSGNYGSILSSGGLKKLKSWVERGGTLITLSKASAALADSSNRFFSIGLVREVYSSWKTPLAENDEVDLSPVDSISLWEGNSSKPIITTVPEKGKEITKKDIDRMSLYSPQGAILAVEVDSLHWLGYGVARQMGAMTFGSDMLWSRKPAEVAARYRGKDALRISGLLWPEASEGWAYSTFLARQGIGKGQVILFSGDPLFRGYFWGTQGLFLNSVFFGPSLGSGVFKK